MSPFEFVTVLISIILGLGITQIMSGVADLIHQWKHVRLYWPHGLWIVLVFILHVQDWWLLYQLRDLTTWPLPMFLFQVLYPIGLFILARILFPMTGGTAATDMKSYYLSNFRKFFFMVMVLSVLSALENVLYHGLGVEGWMVNAGIFLTLGLLALRRQVPEVVHKILALLLLLLMVSGILLNINEWLIAA
ncbi:MAG: hypothetical protein JNN04_15875 [Cyclobacteriaceae bacterium]|nr:hypothetical protein [Cyclobacteriaceae bacterium]